MKIAVISDIHSNIHALESVLADIKLRKAELVVCLGDLVGYCTFPNEVIDTIRAANILTIMGNYDEAVGNELLACGCDYPDPRDMENASKSLNWSIDETSEENKNFLKGLPKELVMTFDKKTVRFVHGSPRRLNEYLKENSAEAGEVMAGLPEDVLVCGHIHKPYFKSYGDKLLINAGSVGKPKTGNPKANYVIIEINGNLKVEIVEVSYNHEKTAAEIEKAGLPAEFAELIRTGRA